MKTEKTNDKYTINMIEGPIFSKIVLFALPLIASSLLQYLFNSADTIVVGRFCGPTALAAIGSTGALTNLIINLFLGLSVGANVVTANMYGAGRYRDVNDTVHSAITLSLLGGIGLAVIGITLSRPLLTLMGTPEDVISQSALYMRIYFTGMPIIMLYNFGSSILRAMGDTKRPLYYLLLAGVLNVGMNIFFVTVFNMGVAGVATATVLSQCVSTFLVIRSLTKADGCFRLDLRNLHITFEKIKRIMKIGIPAGLQGVMFSISNVVIQSSVNSFGSTVMAGSTADSNIESFIYVAMNAVQQTSISFTAQNYGARNMARLKKVHLYCLLLVTGIGVVMGCAVYFNGRTLVSIFSKDEDVIAVALMRMQVISTTYFLCGMQEVESGYLRGLGHSFLPMVISLAGVCGVRLLWIATVFRTYHTTTVLFACYPVSWLIAFICLNAASIHITKKLGTSLR